MSERHPFFTLEERETPGKDERIEVMTRRQLREQVFKMLFAVDFHEAEELDTQEGLFDDAQNCSEKEREYITDRSMQPSMKYLPAGRRSVWQKWILPY